MSRSRKGTLDGVHLMRSGAIVIDEPLDDWNDVDRGELTKDLNDFFHEIGIHDNKINSNNWTGHGGTEWHLPRLVEMYILGFVGGAHGMALNFLIWEYIGG